METYSKIANSEPYLINVKVKNEPGALELKLIKPLTVALKTTDQQSEPDFYICV